MKYIPILLATFLLALTISCNRENALSSYEEPEYCKLATEIINSCAQEFRTEKGLFTIGTGGALMYNVKELDLMCESYQQVNTEEARKLVVECVNRILEKVNADEEIRPYLENFPFTANNIEFGILFFQKKDKHFVKDGFIASAGSLKGKLYYRVFDATEPTTLNTIHEEPFEEGLRIVMQENDTSEIAV